jgi:small-conductance mechanosensitive channel
MFRKNEIEKLSEFRKRPIIITFIGMIMTLILIVVTLDISRRNIIPFVTNQQKYIMAIEAAILAIFVVEMSLRLVTARLHTPQMVEHRMRLRLIVRIVGYSISVMSVISILASNATLGISVGAIAGVVIAFATQNIISSVLATILILSTRMIRVGEEITIGQTKGIIAEINLTQTVLSVEDNIVFVPNSMLISSMVQRRKRNLDKDANIRDW